MSAVGSGDVYERVAREKSSKRNRSTTVRPTRAATAADTDGPSIAIVRERVQLATECATECGHEHVFVETGDLADRRDASVVQLVRRDRADTPEPLDRQPVEERQLTVGRHDEQAVGLGDPARHLRQELRPGHADRDRQAHALADLTAQAPCDLGRRPGQPPHPANVEERLVDREPLDGRGRILEDAKERLARLGVGGHPRRDDDRIGTEAPRLPPAHRGADAVRLGLVARRQHDPRSDDHRPAAQGGVVALLDRGVERVHVGMEDRGLVRHEHMFA